MPGPADAAEPEEAAVPESAEAAPESDEEAAVPVSPEAAPESDVAADEPDGPALPPIPDALLGPLLDAAGETLRHLPPVDLPPAARRLRSFDRRGFATPAARQQLRKLLEEDEGVLAATVLRFRTRPEVTRLAEAWDEAIAAGGDAPADLVTDVAGDGRLPLLASVLTSGLPDCFEFGLGLVVAMAAVAGREAAATDAVRAATAGQGAAKEAARRAEAVRSAAEAEAARLEAALRDERQARRDREQELAGAEARQAELESALAEAQDRVAAAERRSAGAEGRSAEAATRVADVDHRVAAAQRRADDAERRAAAAATRIAEVERRADDAERRAAEATGRAAAAEERACRAETRAAFAEEEAARAPADRAPRAPAAGTARASADSAARASAVGTARAAGAGDFVDRTVLDQIAHAAEDLAAGLRRLADGPGLAPISGSTSALASGSTSAPASGSTSAPASGSTSLPASGSGSAPAAGPGSARSAGRAPRPSPPPPPPPLQRRDSGARAGGGAPPSTRSAPATPRRRAPVRLPPGMLQDDPAAIEAMVRTRGVAVIVDGYNVSMLAWPGASPAEQRERLCDALAEFQLRFRCEVTVVFDGAEVRGVRPLRRRNLRVVFSAAGQEADEVVVGEVMFRPDEVPVIVVSSDREVRAGAEAEGATVLTADTLLQLMRR